MSAACPNFGFVVTVTPRPAASTLQHEAIVGDLVDILDRNDLSLAERRPLQFIVSREGTQATHSDRELVMTWAREWEQYADIRIGDLVDLSRNA